MVKRRILRIIDKDHLHYNEYGPLVDADTRTRQNIIRLENCVHGVEKCEATEKQVRDE